jgi:hypothetical protein
MNIGDIDKRVADLFYDFIKLENMSNLIASQSSYT